MRFAGRAAAAIEVLDDIAARRRPAPDALKDWGLAHRFAGSGDRAAIAGLVYDALRRRASSAYLMGDDSARAITLGMLARERGMNADSITSGFAGEPHAPAQLTDHERAALARELGEDAPAHIRGDYPEWIDDQFAAMFGEDRAEEGAALASRAPLDIRTNTLKAERDQAVQELAHLAAMPASWAPDGLRIVLAAEAKSPSLKSEPPFIRGEVEIQDEGSQLAALLCGAKPNEQVIDLCAGAGGKTLALAAIMQNTGQIFATDSDTRRLAPIHERLTRAGARNVQVRSPRGKADTLEDLKGRADLVVIDAPCTGTGSWRRNPDAKWRLRPGALEIRMREQVTVLDRAVPLLKAGGRIAYITCSVLPEENGGQVRAFLQRHPDFAVENSETLTAPLGERGYLFRRAVLTMPEGILMTPRRTGTDGFFVTVLSRT